MKNSLLNALILTAFSFSCQCLNAAESPETPTLIKNRRQLTQVGPRSGEAYFSPDGKKLIFQSERQEGNPFYQIYSLDLVTGKTDRLSPGQGKTTCSWFHPSMKKALFASTHLDPELKKKVQQELDERKNPQKGKYSWSFDDQFDIFEVDLKSKALKRLTKEKGYDAEGSYSPDGQWIAFASNRSGYVEKLSADDKKLFEQDPSSQMEIYIMKADGSQVKRLTKALGYDGGPFFSADGKKITWRRFSPNGAVAEVWTMNVDGSDQKALTHMNAMSWAPYFHSSGDYLIFTTNKMGYENFELYLVDAEGKNEPQRVSFIDGFDGLPVFSPDGQKLVWTHKDEKGESQIFMADWDDIKARELLGLSQKVPRAKELLGNFNQSDAHRLVSYLASAEMNGRMTGSPEEKRMTSELGSLMQGLGLKPYDGQSFTQEFGFTSGVELGAKNSLTLKQGASGKDVSAKIEKDFSPVSFSKSGTFESAPVAFAGYGILAQASEKQPVYDSYKDLNVKGKWVLIFRDIPQDVDSARRVFLSQASQLHYKALVARQAGAIGLLVATGPQSGSKQKVMKLRFDGSFAEAGIPVLSVSDEWANQLLASTGTSLESWQKELDKGQIKGVDEIQGARVAAQVELKDLKSTGHNTIGWIQVPGAKKTLLIGAHGDHLGHGDNGSSLAKGSEQGEIHYGADDNASGVAALFMIMQDYQRKMQTGWRPKQNIAFAVWSGEEMGMLGSSAFLKKNTKPISAYLNMDMVGRLRETLLVQGTGSAKEWRPLLEPIGIRSGLSVSMQEDPYLPTDSMAFYLKSIPTVTFFTGAHAEYHSPRDRVETLNEKGIAQIATFVGQVGESLTMGPMQPTYQKVESSHRNLEGRKFRVYLGTIPDYTQEKIKGVLISGTSKNSPAEKAGLVAGDVIRELGGTKIENLYDYVYVLQGLKPNEQVSMQVERSGKTVKMDITPVVKE